MRTWLQTSGWLWLLLIPSLVRAQTMPMTEDDVVISAVTVPSVAHFKIEQGTFDQIVCKKPEDVQFSQLVQQHTQYLENIRHECALSENQFVKLRLALIADARQTASDYIALSNRFVNVDVSREDYAARHAEIFRKLALPLADPHGEHSLFFKVLRHHATSLQWQRYVELDLKERKELLRKHFAQIFANRRTVEDGEFDKIASLTVTRFPHCRRLPLEGYYSTYVILLMASELEHEIKPHLTVAQIIVFNKKLQTVGRVEGAVRQMGLYPIPAK